MGQQSEGEFLSAPAVVCLTLQCCWTSLIFFFFCGLQMVERYIREAQGIMATQDPHDVAFAISILDAGLEICPRNETAMELKARSLLFLRRFRDVAHMLRDYIPSFKPSSSAVSEDDAASSSSDSCVSSSSSTSLSREKLKLLGSVGEENESGDDVSLLKCFSISELKRRVLAGVCRNAGREGQWRWFLSIFFPFKYPPRFFVCCLMSLFAGILCLGKLAVILA